MEIQFEPAWLAGLVEQEAAERGLSDRLRSLAANREADGLDGMESLIDAADSLGVVDDARRSLEGWLGGVDELEVSTILVGDVHGGMPTWRRTDGQALLQLPVEPLSNLQSIVERFVALLNEDPERLSAVVPVGLGGTGGCACGDELPEDAPPGPLFERAP